MPDCRITGKRLQGRLIEDISHQPHSFMALGFALFAGYDPRALLPPVLKSIKAKIREVRGFGMAEDSKNTTFFSRSIYAFHGF
jgi:hypothetical protein